MIQILFNSARYQTNFTGLSFHINLKEARCKSVCLSVLKKILSTGPFWSYLSLYQEVKSNRVSVYLWPKMTVKLYKVQERFITISRVTTSTLPLEIAPIKIQSSKKNSRLRYQKMTSLYYKLCPVKSIELYSLLYSKKCCRPFTKIST